MKIFPSIDIYEGKVVRLYKGDYSQMTVYSENPVEIAKAFKAQGADQIHIVDLEGARDGTTPNVEVVKKIKDETGLFCEIGGGIRSIEMIDAYIDAGLDRVILGTAALEDQDFLKKAIKMYGSKIAVGVDIKDRKVAIKGWVKTSNMDAFEFCKELQKIGVKTIICTDISKDGAMQGPNIRLYEKLNETFTFNVIASGGVSSIQDVLKLYEINLYGAIIGKAYYVGAIDLKKAIEVTK